MQRRKDGHQHVLAMKLSTLEIWCYQCEVWLGIPNRSKIESIFVRDIQRQILLGSQDLSCFGPIGEQEAEFPVLDPTSVWYMSTFNERRQREREISLQLHHEKAYLLSIHWASEWRAFELGMRGPPDEIDNRPLLNNRGRVRRNIQINVDAWAIPEQSWRELVKIYGGGPAISEGKWCTVRIHEH
jgi:hypothetical protein